MFEKALTGVKNLSTSLVEGIRGLPTFLQKSLNNKSGNAALRSFQNWLKNQSTSSMVIKLVLSEFVPGFDSFFMEEIWNAGYEQEVYLQGLHDVYPAPLPQLPAGDGSGGYAVRTPTPLDFLKKGVFYILSYGSRLVGYVNASRNLRHFLDNTGKPQFFNPEDMLKDMPQFETVTNHYLSTQLPQVISGSINNYYKEESLTIKTSLPWQRYRQSSGDWYFAINDFSYTYKLEINIIPTANGRRVEVAYRLCVYDLYNWDKGKSVKIIRTISDSENSELHSTGLAREYEIFGMTKAATRIFDEKTQMLEGFDIIK